MKSKKAVVDTQAVADALVAAKPEGWTVTSGVGYVDCYGEVVLPGKFGGSPDDRWVTLTRAAGGLSVILAMNVTAPDDWSKQYAWRGATVEGHTIFNGRTFTRRGIDVSSCALRPGAKYEHEYADLPALLAGEWARCEVAEARQRTAVAIPGTSLTRQPDWFKTAGATLRAGKSVTAAPSGFGTGYVFYAKPGPRGRTRRVAPKLEELLGTSPVYYETIDCD